MRKGLTPNLRFKRLSKTKGGSTAIVGLYFIKRQTAVVTIVTNFFIDCLKTVALGSFKFILANYRKRPFLTICLLVVQLRANPIFLLNVILMPSRERDADVFHHVITSISPPETGRSSLEGSNALPV